MVFTSGVKKGRAKCPCGSSERPVNDGSRSELVEIIPCGLNGRLRSLEAGEQPAKRFGRVHRIGTRTITMIEYNGLWISGTAIPNPSYTDYFG